ncbi:CocE/NonD family hydrolase [Temperatibacter marinus]|uniref:CocE/NonD family hydrolase n=1 Tax=Temperatibacter marinus TaxID=1456591 RepID=A0AA52EKU5_9PROT|nr:CocE/NonD family hydrolase [Temperatibacter marinus]WND04094.1 CocE/NonD family hydrolase [Temperatibacter marinus]
MKNFFLIVALASALFCSSHATGQDILKSQMVPMRDGVHLSTDIYFEGSPDIPRPTILVRTVYNKNHTFGWNQVWKELVSQGYAIAIQDIRGRFESEGAYTVARGRREDGMDTLDWITNQAWSNGKVGLSGCSYLGEAQVVLAATHHKALITANPQSPASGYYRPGRAWQSFSGGAFELGQTAGWFAGSGTKTFNGPDLKGEARSQWFNDPKNAGTKLAPETNFAAYLAGIKSLPVISLLSRHDVPKSDYEDWRSSAPDGDYFRTMDLVQAQDSVSIPNLFFDTWYDYGARETLMMANQFKKNGKTEKAKNNQYVIIGPGTHCNYPEKDKDVSAGNRPMKNAAQAYNQIQIDWYNHWLKGEENTAVNRPFLTYYVLGADEWKTSDTWPLKNTNYTKWYLTKSPGPYSQANSLRGDGKLSLSPSSKKARDDFVYDPENPVPSLGGHTCCTGTDTEAGGYDQRKIEERQDVLVYTSDSLPRDIEVTGLIKAKLFVASSARDTDFTVKLVDVYPDGTAYNVQEGVLRMRYRNSLREAQLMEAGKIYSVEVDLNATSNLFKKGHKIRIEISSSNFPRIERNLNTGASNARSTSWIKAVNTLWHGGNNASYIELPVIVEKD